jgi:hypothetical protein
MIDFMKEPALLALLVLFVAVLVLRSVKAYFLAKRLRSGGNGLPSDADARLVELVENAKTPGKARDAIREVSRVAHAIPSSSKRSAYYCAAGNLAIHPLKRPGSAVGLFLKALRADPTCIEAIVKLQDILTAQKRYRRLEWTYWEVLARLDDSEVGEEVWIACWSGLAAIYAASPRTVRRADAIRKSIAAYVQEDDDDLDEHGHSSRIPKVSIIESSGE